MKHINIAILDSGVNTKHKDFESQDLVGFALKINRNGMIEKSDDFNDEIGHGTAIYYLIKRATANIPCSITNIKIISSNINIDCDEFCYYPGFICGSYGTADVDGETKEMFADGVSDIADFINDVLLDINKGFSAELGA